MPIFLSLPTKILLWSLLAWFSASPLSAQSNWQSLATAVKALDQDPVMRSANWGVILLNPRTEEVVFSHQADRSLVTASTMKALTTATALSVLGASHQFATVLEFDGSIGADGVLRGNVYIRGGGDPSLGSDRFGDSYALPALLQQWQAAVQAAGIQRIAGQVIADASIYGTQVTPAKWPWEDMGNYYGAGAGGLNLHENLYYLDFKTGPSQGDATEVLRTRPEIPGIRFVNEIVSGRSGSGDNGYIFGSPYTFERYLRGTLPPGRSTFTIKGSIPDPALLTAQVLETHLTGAGILIDRGASSLRLLRQEGPVVSGNRQVLHTHLSPTLRDLVEETNQHSLNLYAEALLLATGYELDQSRNTTDALDALANFWAGKGIPFSGIYLRDGSGLSPNNAISPRQMARVMAKAHGAAWFSSFEGSLPVAGRSGTLKRMMRGTSAEGRVRAKTGYISGVLGYVGFVQTVDGEDLCFALMANYYSCSTREMRNRLSRIMVKMAEGK
ncbi:MAG: D-alanyl-D-alanine carboxypeptidase/D-alanyl-D-alanine-endopeptidase [Bacteroidota bacterium]